MAESAKPLHALRGPPRQCGQFGLSARSRGFGYQSDLELTRLFQSAPRDR